MRRALLGYVHLDARIRRHERSGSAGMVEMDVGHEQVAQVGDGRLLECGDTADVVRVGVRDDDRTQVCGVEPEAADEREDRRRAAWQTGVDQREPVVEIEQIGADKLFFAEKTEVEKLRHVSDRNGCSGRSSR